MYPDASKSAEVTLDSEASFGVVVKPQYCNDCVDHMTCMVNAFFK